MFPSTRNNTDSQVSLLRVTNCQKLLYGKEYTKRIQPWVQESGIGALEMLGLEQVLDDAPAPVHPYEETFESARFDPVIILHTSGSTGTPKPIYCNQGLFSSADRYHDFLEYEGFPFIMEAMATYSNKTYCPRMSTTPTILMLPFTDSGHQKSLCFTHLVCTASSTLPHSGANLWHSPSVTSR